MSELPDNFDPTKSEIAQSADDWFMQKVNEINSRAEDLDKLRGVLKGRYQISVDRTHLEKLIPHRRPFMFLEDVKVIEPGKRAIGILADLREPDFDFLRGHFPARILVTIAPGNR